MGGEQELTANSEPLDGENFFWTYTFPKFVSVLVPSVLLAQSLEKGAIAGGNQFFLFTG